MNELPEYGPALRTAGAMIGAENAAQWRHLVTVYGMEGVRFGIARARVEVGRTEGRPQQVTAEQVAKELGQKLSAPSKAPTPTPPLAPVVEKRGKMPMVVVVLIKMGGSASVKQLASQSGTTVANVYYTCKRYPHLIRRVRVGGEVLVRAMTGDAARET